VNKIISDDPALAPLLQTFPEPYPQDSPELIKVRKLQCGLIIKIRGSQTFCLQSPKLF
jgi:hypothetical protein